MSELITNFIDTLPKETVTREEFGSATNAKIAQFLTYFDSLRLTTDIYKITDTLFYVKKQDALHVSQHFIETAYENMIISFELYFLKSNDKLYHSGANIYKLIAADTWCISFVRQHGSFRDKFLQLTILNRGEDYEIASIRPQTQIGQYLQLGGDHSSLSSFFKKLVSYSPIILPAQLPSFPGKIEEAFVLHQGGVVGIQFIDLMDNIETI